MQEWPANRKEGSGNNIETGAASEADVGGILAVEEQHLLSPQIEQDTPGEQLKDKGFLVHKLEQADLEDLLQRDDSAVIVCKHNGEVIGYAVGYALKHQLEMHPEWPSTVHFLNEADRDRLLSGQIWYYRQQAIGRTWQGKGISKQLSASMREAAAKHGCTSTVGEILEEPYHNDASFRATSDKTKIIGRIPETYEGVAYVWALVETPLS